MIGKARTGDRFAGLQRYLLGGAEGSERVDWTATRNLWLDEVDLAADQMEATAAQNARVEKPVYHLSLSLRPDESLSRTQWEEVTDRVLGKLGLGEHQALIVAHRDQDHQHVHAMVNRVHPETHRAWDNKNDWRRIERVLREVEREHGLVVVRGHHGRSGGDRPPDRSEGRSSAELHQAAQRGETVWVDQVRSTVRPLLGRAEGWRHLEQLLDREGLRLERRGQGLIVTDGERAVKASRVARGASARRLAERFGESFDEWMSGRAEIERAARSVLHEVGEPGEAAGARTGAQLAKIERDPAFRRNLVDGEEVEQLLRQAGLRHGPALAERRRYGRHHLASVEGVLRHDDLRATTKVRQQAARDLQDQLVRLYGDAGAVRARREIVRMARREGWGGVVDALASRPEKLGRLAGPIREAFRGPAPPEHLSYFAAAAAQRYHAWREEERRLRRSLVRWRQSVAGRGRARLDRALPRAPDSGRGVGRAAVEALGRHLARRGVRVLQNALLPPTFRVVMTALRTAGVFVRSAEREGRAR